MRVLVSTAQVPFVHGGAEIHADNLVEAIRRAGHEVDLVQIPFKWYPPEKILDHLLACRLLDLSNVNGIDVDRVIGLKFPAYHVPHPNKVLWILHQHRTVFDLWETPDADLAYYPQGTDIRNSVVEIERQLLQESKALYANSRNVADRLANFCSHSAEPLYHPPKAAEKFYTELAEDYLFYPSRLCGLKRQDLVLRALAKTKEPVKIRFAGKPDNAQFLKDLQALANQLGISNRVEWLGMISEESKRDLYARCLGVVFPPLDEDYGYITLETMLSSKPVITCTDSGGPLEFIEDHQCGLIARPAPESLAQEMDRLWSDRRASSDMGLAARQKYQDLNISWEHVVETLLHAN